MSTGGRVSSWRAWARAAALAIVGAACVATSVETPAVPGAAGRPKDTIVIGMSGEPDTLFAPGSSRQVQLNVTAVLSQGLTVRDDQNVYQPRLALTTPTIENGGALLTKTADGKDLLTVTYRIRPGAKFSNGEPVTSDDVRYSWELCLNPDAPIVSRTTCTYYDRINTPDPATVEVVYKPGRLDPLYFSFCCTIVPRKVYGAADPAKLRDGPLGRAPVYAGPYRVREWVAGSSITVEANPDFWLGVPKTKTLVFTFVPDPNALLAQLRAGQIDVATNDGVTLELIPGLDRLAAETKLRPSYVPAQVWEHLDFNLRDPKDLSRPHPILQDGRVRRAIAQGIDRDAITTRVLHGKVTPIHSFLYGSSWARAADSELTVYPYDPDAARKLLEDAGWTAGTDGTRERRGARLELRLGSTAGNGLREQTAQLIADQLRAIGVNVTLDLLPAASWLATRGAGPLSAGTFDLGLYAWVQGDDPQTHIYGCDQIPTKENGFSGQNYPGYCNRDFDAAMAVANAKLLRSERRASYLAAQKIWTADLPVLPLYQRPNIDVASGELRGFRGTPTSTPVTFNAWEWELPAG